MVNLGDLGMKAFTRMEMVGFDVYGTSGVDVERNAH